MSVFRIPNGWEDLPPGTKVHMSIDKEGLDDFFWRGTSVDVLGTVISRGDAPQAIGRALVLLNKPVVGSFSLGNSVSAQQYADPKFTASISRTDKLLSWVCSPEAVRLYDPTYLSPHIVKGVHTCSCGAMNVDPSETAFIGRKYVCYSCRIIMPREQRA